MTILKIIIKVVIVSFVMALLLNAQDIFQSAENGDIETIKNLLKRDANVVNARNDDGDTPLHIAVLNGRIDIIEFLLAQNPDLEIRNDRGFTPLLCASWMFHRASVIDYRRIIESLLAHGAEANVTGDGGNNPLHWINHPSENSLAELKGPYLGQPPPGMTPEIFAPGIVSTGYNERTAAFTPDGKELYYVLWGAPHGVILVMKEANGRWTKPEVAPFSGRYQGDFTMSADGRRIVFSSNSPYSAVGKPQDQYYCWIVERTANSWGNPHPFGPLINMPDSFAGCPTIADNGNLYFFSDRSGNIGSEDIWLSPCVNGKYEEPQNLGDAINTEDFELDPFISPDESYLIFSRIDKKRERGADLFIAFRRSDGSWTSAVNMGEEVNSIDMEYCPTVSPDGKYLFFTSNRTLHEPYSKIPLSFEKKLKILNSPGNGSADIYWVDAKIIEDLKPKELK